MTIIATDGKMVAADTLVVRGYQEVTGAARKIFAAKKGNRIVVLGFTGSAWGFAPCAQWWLKGAKPEDFPLTGKENNAALDVFEYGKAPMRYVDSSYGWPVHQISTYADGCGDDFAYALLRSGATAIRAVEEVCRIAAACKPPVEAFDLVSGEWATKMKYAPNADFMKEVIEKNKGWKVV